MAKKISIIDRKRLWHGNYACSDTVAEDGRFLVGAADNRGGYGIYTSDGGDTYEMIRDLRKIPHMRRLSDGRYFAPGFGSLAVHHFDPEVQEKIPYVMKKNWAASFDALLAGNVQTEFEVLDIPELAVGYGDSGDRRNWGTGVTGSGYLELDNGDILISMYGQFKSDRTRLPYFTAYEFYQYRTWVMVSHDGGKSFSYLSTVADTGTYPIDCAAEGYCEPDLMDLGGGHVLCVMRTQGHEVYSPMYAAHSYDYGRTWEAPYQICPYGVLPKMLRMEDGTIVCTSGKWDIFLIYSEDEGRTWSEPFVLQENKGQWDRGPSGYNSIMETKPGVLLLIYDTTDDPVSNDIVPGERRIVYADRVRVE